MTIDQDTVQRQEKVSKTVKLTIKNDHRKKVQETWPQGSITQGGFDVHVCISNDEDTEG